MFLPDLNTRQIKNAYYHTIHLYQEQTRRIHSHSSGQGTSSSTSWSSGSGSASARIWGGSTTTSAGGPGISPNVIGLQPGSESWFSSGESSSDLSSHSSSEFSSQGESGGQSYFESEGETEVPVWVPIPIQELGSEAEWSLEEKVSKIAELLKCQQQRHCFIKTDAEDTQPLRVPHVPEYFFTPEDLQEYVEDVYTAQGALPSSTVDSLVRESEQEFLTGAIEVLKVNRPIDGEANVASSRGDGPFDKPTRTRPKGGRRSATKSLFATIKGPTS